MRRRFLGALVLTLLFGGTYWYVATAEVCPVPIHYRLSEYDPRFSLSAEEIKLVLLEAEQAWEKATGRELFVYDEEAEFTINFIFDERQRQALNEEELRAQLNEKESQSNKTLEQVTKLNRNYEVLKAKYETGVTAYNSRLRSYNARVDEVNASGGADQGEMEELTREKRSLATEGEELEVMTTSLRKLVEEINNLGEYGNQLINDYNKEVVFYNDSYGEAGAFTQGEFVGDKINIYKFSDRNELSKVIAHEFGHALGLEHVEKAEAIMYYLLEQQPAQLTLSSEDVSAFKSVCGDGNDFSHRLRIHVRTLLALIT